MALNMNDFSDSLAGLPGRINGPVLASAGVAFAAGIGAALFFSGPSATSPGTVAAAQAVNETCVVQTWPYREQKCRDAEAGERKLRDVRIVSTDKTQPPRVVKSAVADDAPAKAVAAPAPQVQPVSSGNQQYAATWLMGIDQMPSHATVTPHIASLSLASANLPLPPTTLDVAPSAAAPVETADPQLAETAVPAVAPQQKRIRTAVTKPAAAKNNATLTLVRTYEFADGRQVTVRHQIKSGEDRPALEADGVLSDASSRNARVIRDDD